MMTLSLLTMIAPMNPYWRIDATSRVLRVRLQIRDLQVYDLCHSLLLRFGTAATGGAGVSFPASSARRFRTRPVLSPPKQTLLNFPAPSRAPLSGAPWGGTKAGFRGSAPVAPWRAFFRGRAAGGLPCAARTRGVLGGFWRVLGAGPRGRPRPRGATASRMDGYCRALGFFRKEGVRGSVGGLARAIRATHEMGSGGLFSCAPPSPRRQIDRWVWRGRNSIFTSIFPLSLHTFARNPVSAFMSALCRHPPTQEAFERGLVSTKTTLADITPTQGAGRSHDPAHDGLSAVGGGADMV